MATEQNREFEWDPAKAAANLKKHKGSFIEAAPVFSDPYTVITEDEMHSDDELRQVATGNSNRNRILLVSFIEYVLYQIRILSARKATPTERKRYEEKS